uniref:DEAD domain-containing protein n=1 Tax=Strongyloides venezuelensis TaxID=75913 RepID=A0A0K0F2Z5_STRVS
MFQIHEQVRKFCDRSQYGCATYIIVTTQGRLNKFLFKGYVHLNKLCSMVLDDANRLMEYNFANDITNTLEFPSCVPLMSRQNLLFLQHSHQSHTNILVNRSKKYRYF